jgi:hypothetical protein
VWPFLGTFLGGPSIWTGNQMAQKLDFRLFICLEIKYTVYIRKPDLFDFWMVDFGRSRPFECRNIWNPDTKVRDSNGASLDRFINKKKYFFSCQNGLALDHSKAGFLCPGFERSKLRPFYIYIYIYIKRSNLADRKSDSKNVETRTIRISDGPAFGCILYSEHPISGRFRLWNDQF